jgi:phosphatidylglycerophosphate synthase
VAVAVLLSLEEPPFALLAALFGAGIASDILDGALARRSGSVSARGSFLDAFADKLLVLAVLGPLAAREPSLLPALVALLVRDAIVTVYRVERLRHGEVVAVTRLARLKTALLFGGCQLYLTAGAVRAFGGVVLAEILIAAGIAAAVLSAVHYLFLRRRAHA